MSFAAEPTHPLSVGPTAALTFGAVAHSAKQTAPPPAETKKEEKKVSEQDVKKIVHEINEHLQLSNTELNFSVDEESKKMVMKVVNKTTGELIRQIPAEDALRLAAHISKLLGILVDENA
jgi:flagellar protein FlaG